MHLEYYNSSMSMMDLFIIIRDCTGGEECEYIFEDMLRVKAGNYTVTVRKMERFTSGTAPAGAASSV